MKTSFRPSKVKGFALVIVLATLVLLVALAIGFLIRATTERGAASGARSAASARLLADTCVSLVQGQINIASTQGSTVSWVSQPGMVRTFNSTGGLLNAYKLYSSPNMAESTVNISDDAPPADWNNNVAIWTDLNSPVSGNYPILNPSAVGNVEGFKVTGAPAATYTGANTLPMPVQWLYVLRDGAMVAPTGSGSNANVAGATTANPIVGRVAFWTDDDSCKININTASEGTYWDTPHADTTAERLLASHQPVAKEFQRYPGHPAMTSLSCVFPTLTPEQIYAIVPRVNGGGSDAGNAQTVSAANSSSGTPGALGPVGVQIVPDSDRLYASVDELMFDPNRAKNAGLNKDMLEQTRFFLTARSRAPEVNLFNLPRIAVWPINSTWALNPIDSNAAGKAKTNPFDRLIAYCSTINGKPYYFQRANSSSQTELTDIARNTQLYAYLQSLTGRTPPGFSSNFLSKYPTDRDQILTEIFDYIRCINPTDETLAQGNRFTPDFTTSAQNQPLSGYGQVTPTVKGTTMGFGRAYTLSELAIAFVCLADGSNVNNNNVPRPSNPTPLLPNQIRVVAIIIPEFFSPMQGFAGIVPSMQLLAQVTPGMTYSGTATGGPLSFSNVAPKFTEEAGRYAAGTTEGGGLDWVYFAVNRPDSEFPNYLVSNSIVIDTTQLSVTGSTPTVHFSGGKISIQLRHASPALSLDTSPNTQTFKLLLPAGDFPLPKLSGNKRFWELRNNSPYTDPDGPIYRFRSIYAKHDLFPLDPSVDVVRSILPAHGDYRLIAAKQNITDTSTAPPIFAKHPDWDNPNQQLATCLFGGQMGDAIGLSTASTYFPSITNYSAAAIPDIVPGATQTPAATGDFDTGMDRSVDGAYVNKTDQGNTDAQNTDPYFNSNRSIMVNTTFYSPNRQMPSPGMFGSLPTGVFNGLAGKPWQTLLFRPQKTHPSYNPAIPDHLFMDLFWMPVVEPYAISEPFSTAGKINLNYQILPFTYITRSTGINALLKSEKVAAIPNGVANTYKAGNPSLDIRKTINVDETLSQFTSKFNAQQVFRSASEIADIHIVPTGATAAGMDTYWNSFQLTGDNLRERIYTTLYPRLTTKSNTFTVHFRAQALSKASSSAPGTWTEGRDKINGEYRGSTTIERFIDSTNTSIPDYGSNPTATPTLDAFYRWRTVENKQFAP